MLVWTFWKQFLENGAVDGVHCQGKGILKVTVVTENMANPGQV